MTSPIDRQRMAQTHQARTSSSSGKAGAEAKKIDAFIQGAYPEVHRSDVMDTLDYALGKLKDRQLGLGGDDRESSNMITPHDPRVSGG